MMVLFCVSLVVNFMVEWMIYGKVRADRDMVLRVGYRLRHVIDGN